MFTGKGSSLALAFVCSKAMVPIKLPVAAAITPYVHRYAIALLQNADCPCCWLVQVQRYSSSFVCVRPCLLFTTRYAEEVIG